MTDDHKARNALVAASMVGMASVIAGATTTYGPWSSSKYTEEGGTHLDNATKVLNQTHESGPHKDEYIIPVAERTAYARTTIDPLTDERTRLNRETKTISGSVKNWVSSNRFYRDAKASHSDARALSQASNRDSILGRGPTVDIVVQSSPINSGQNPITASGPHPPNPYVPNMGASGSHTGGHRYPPSAPQEHRGHGQYSSHQPPATVGQGQRTPSIESTSDYATARTHQSSQYSGDHVYQYGASGSQYPSGNFHQSSGSFEEPANYQHSAQTNTYQSQYATTTTKQSRSSTTSNPKNYRT